MENQIIFFHGGGSVEDFEADGALVESLKMDLGKDYKIRYPFLPNDGSADFGRRKQIRKELNHSDDNVLIVAHSLGASMLLACLSEYPTDKKIAGIFLLATPFWQGNEDWVQALKLLPDFATKLDQTIPIFFYHCQDDEEVPFEHFHTYKEKLPWAAFRTISAGGHQFTGGLLLVVEDIRSLRSSN